MTDIIATVNMTSESRFLNIEKEDNDFYLTKTIELRGETTPVATFHLGDKEDIQNLSDTLLKIIGDAAWQPIETAPLDRPFLAYENGAIYACWFLFEEDGANWYASGCGQPIAYTPEPTHWMPLPKAPAVSD